MPSGRIRSGAVAKPAKRRSPTQSSVRRERASTQEALRYSTAQLRAVLDTAVDAIITIDGCGVMLSANPATVRMFGYSQAQMIRQNISMLMPSPHREAHDGYIARYLQTGEKRIIGIGREVVAQRKDGTTFPVDLAVSEVEPGRLFTGIVRDISDRRLAETRLREADRMASIGALAAGLGHDMNNVLLPIRAHLNALKADAAASTRRDHVDRILKGVSYLQQLADGLHFLAMDPDKEDDAGGVTNLKLWWAQTGALLSKAVPKHAKVSSTMPDGLPEIAVTAHALTQAVLNLIVNAGEAIPRDRKRRQGHVRFWAKLEPDGNSVRLGVTDNGTGMSEAVKRHAFDMFFTTKPRGLGTGLGLAMVRKVADRSRGSVHIDSVPGKGTTVAMVFPTAHPKDEKNVRRLAAVHIRDGRAASLVQHLLEAAGTNVAADGITADAEILVVEPTPAGAKVAKAWRSQHPRGRLVCFGRPTQRIAAGWKAIHALTIDDRNDFEEVRAALSLATTLH